jgi:HAD superfamily hydrolase (TIGR01509 family)
MAAPSAVLFDFDGVLADTENIHIAAWERTFQSMGWDISPEVCARSAEQDDRHFLAEVFDSLDVTGDLDGWMARKHRLALELLGDEPRLYPGTADLVRWLAPRCRIGIVSASWLDSISAVLDSAGLTSFFSLIVAKEDCKQTKPDPAPYLIATERLGLPPGRCIALEDSPTGLASARSAGVPCVAIGHRRAEGYWCQGADFLPHLGSLETASLTLGFRRDPADC